MLKWSKRESVWSANHDTAQKCPHIKVTVVDINASRIVARNDQDLSKLPVFEPGLDKIVE